MPIRLWFGPWSRRARRRILREMGESREPSTADVLTALEDTVRAHEALVLGVERRLGAKIDHMAEQLVDQLPKEALGLREKCAAAKQPFGERLARVVEAPQIVVHVEIFVSELEKRADALVRRLEELESRTH